MLWVRGRWQWCYGSFMSIIKHITVQLYPILVRMYMYVSIVCAWVWSGSHYTCRYSLCKSSALKSCAAANSMDRSLLAVTN